MSVRIRLSSSSLRSQLAHESLDLRLPTRILEVMKREPAGHDIESRIRESESEAAVNRHASQRTSRVDDTHLVSSSRDNENACSDHG